LAFRPPGAEDDDAEEDMAAARTRRGERVNGDEEAAAAEERRWRRRRVASIGGLGMGPRRLEKTGAEAAGVMMWGRCGRVTPASARNGRMSVVLQRVIEKSLKTIFTVFDKTDHLKNLTWLL
jgi:hypothetical protein